jgi:GrpB-like predicted nucleotidyltransferase (UPF0157 family)
MIGLPQGIVKLAPHSPEWARLFEEEKARLLVAAGPHVLDIQHVGSTSIPGISAKPIIDIAIAVNDFDEARVCIEPIVALGYEYKGEFGIPRRHYFTRGNPRTHHVHMNEVTSQDWQQQILFRDYLRRHAEMAQRYAALKTELAHRFPTDREAYTEAKSPFIREVLRLAREESV